MGADRRRFAVVGRATAKRKLKKTAQLIVSADFSEIAEAILDDVAAAGGVEHGAGDERRLIGQQP